LKTNEQNNTTANVIEFEKDFIMDDWLETVRSEVGVAQSKSDAQLINHLSLFLTKLISALRTDQAIEIKKLFHDSNIISREHGEQRSLIKDYTLDEIIQEYHLLRETIFDHLNNGKLETFSYKDMVIINNFIDQSISSAATEFMNKETKTQEEIKNRLEVTLEKYKETVKARDTFLSIASHELKTPLTSLMLQAQMRKRQLLKGNVAAFETDKLKDMFEADVKQLSGLNRLIDDMLDISRIRTGRLELNKEKIDFSQIAVEVFERFRPQIEELCKSFDYRAEKNILIEADAYRMEQVITNLLTNAMKYGKGKPLAAKVFCDKNHKKAFLVVRDNGIGIDEADQERIFQTFERAISANEVSGLGLGLSIVKEIVETHGGEVLLDSEVGVGSTFTVSLPLIHLH
jgi:signal transduction histidine kinase